MNYALAICHLGDRILGAPPFIQPFPGSERALTLAEVQEMQVRLTKAGFDTGGTDGRVGNDTMQAIRDYQTRWGSEPADGYGGLEVLARLRQGNDLPLTSFRGALGAPDRIAVGDLEFRPRSPPRNDGWSYLITAGPRSGTATSSTRNCTRSVPCQRSTASDPATCSGWPRFGSGRCRVSGRSSETRCR